VRSIDELPILAVLAARARGTTVVRDAEELRVKESDRIATTCAMLRSFGIACEVRPDGFTVEGRPDRPFEPGRVLWAFGFRTLSPRRRACSSCVGAISIVVPSARAASLRARD
jgi:hypothetical protein